MDSLFAELVLADVRQDVARNIVSLRQSHDLYDDLSTDPADWLRAERVEDEVRPPPHVSPTPVIDGPFEDAAWFSAIEWPFKHWQSSRFSDGSYGVWFGSDSVETTVYESAYHWYSGFLTDAGFEREAVIAERTVFLVSCAAALLDLRRASALYPDLLHPTDYGYCQSVGARIHREGHPGLLIQSVRRSAGENLAIFNPSVLSQPRHHCHLTYFLQHGQIQVRKQPNSVWLNLSLADLAWTANAAGGAKN